MPSPSKENNILKLLLETSPLKEWHFEEIVKEAKVTKAVANKWLKKYVQEKILKKVKPKNKFPFFTAGLNNNNYKSLKRIYALEQMYKTGLISKLLSLNATIIIFGSMIKGDWYKDSDIDIFILKKKNSEDFRNFNKKAYELRLQRNIELHIFENKKELKEIKTGLVKNIINGYVIKGQIQDVVNIS